MSCCPPSITPDFAGGGDSGGGGGGGVQSVNAGTNITISGTPTNPVVNALAGVSAVEGLQGSINLVGANCSITTSGQDITITVPAPPAGAVQSVAGATGVITMTGTGCSITGGGTNISIAVPVPPVASVAGLTGVLTLGSSDSTVTITPAGTNIDLKAVSASAVPNKNVNKLISFEALNQNVSSIQYSSIFYGVDSVPTIPPWTITAQFVKFDFYLPCIRTLTTTGPALAAAPNETFIFQGIESLSSSPIPSDSANLTITQNTGLTTNGQTNKFVLEGSIVIPAIEFNPAWTQLFPMISATIDEPSGTAFIAYTLNQVGTNNWCVAYPLLTQ